MVETSRQTNKDETIVEVNGYVHDGWLKRMVEEDGYVHDKWQDGYVHDRWLKWMVMCMMDGRRGWLCA